MTKQKETSEEEVRYEGSAVFQPISGLGITPILEGRRRV